MNDINLESWVQSILVDPLTKRKVSENSFPNVRGVRDARVFLRNANGFIDWEKGQDFFESWESSSRGYEKSSQAYRNEIDYDREVYEHFQLAAPILDVGGLMGTVREFLPIDVQFVSVDPYISAPYEVPLAKADAYTCLKRPLNFIAGMSEFLPFEDESFQTVHMRSMLDHVQVPDLAILEAWRTLKIEGVLLVGISIDGPPYGGRPTVPYVSKLVLKKLLTTFRLPFFANSHDHHTWHPTLNNLKKLISDNRFSLEEVYWQRKWKGKVVYIKAVKKSS